MSIRRLVSKKGLVVIIAFLAILSLSVSLFAESAGGTRLQALDAAAHQGNGTAVGSLVDLASTADKTAGDNSESGQAGKSEASSSASTTVTVSEDSQSASWASSSSTSQKDSSDPDTAPNGSTPPVTGSPAPTTHCATCPVPDNGSPAACPDYCLAPTPPVSTGPTPPPVTGCQPCGGLGPASRSGAIMCAMYCVE